mgnify:CR=1 FL=1
MSEWTLYKNGILDTHKKRNNIMLDFVKIKTDLEDSFNREKSTGVDIDINVTVLSESDGKFSVSVFEEKCYVNNQHLPKADITVGFVNKDTMIDMFTGGADPMKLVMGGQMTFNGDMGKGKSLKGLFIGER